MVSACSQQASGAEFCSNIDELANLQNEASEAASTPEGFGEFIRRMTTVTESMAESAPEDIKADAEQLSQSMHQIDAILVSVNYDMSKLGPQETAALNDSKFSEAADAVTSRAKTDCGIDIGPRGSDQTSDSTPDTVSSQPVEQGPVPQEGDAPSQ